MTRWWMALMIVGAALPTSVLAQMGGHFNGGGGPPSDGPKGGPISRLLKKEPPPMMKPDPNFGAAPPMLLTEDGSPNAFACFEPYNAETGCYASLGFMALQRARLGHSLIAVQDPGRNIPPIPTPFFDHGFQPPTGLPAFVDSASLGMEFNFGVRGALGYYFGDDSFEVSYYYIPSNTSQYTWQNQARLDLPFAVSPAFPVGFSGDNGMWLQADVVRLESTTTIGNVEFNLRRAVNSTMEWIVGLRYFDYQEVFGIYTGDDDLTVVPVDRTNQATYSITTHNRILAPQLGLEAEWCLREWLAFGVQAKGAWGANFLSVQTLLQRGDGFVPPSGPNNSRFNVQFSHLYEFGAFFDFFFSERIAVRAGYQGLLIANIPEAIDNVDYNLTHVNGHKSSTGFVFYSGPLFELRLRF